MKLMRRITAIFIIGFVLCAIVMLYVGFHIFAYQGKDEPPESTVPYNSKVEKQAQKEGLYDTTNEPIVHHVNDVYNGQPN